jgi:hypothetical protein
LNDSRICAILPQIRGELRTIQRENGPLGDSRRIT